jgi:sugar/nucleoside kinase (ribokinase family)
MNYYPIYLDGDNVTKTRLIDKRHKYHIVRIDNDTIADTTSPRVAEIKGYIETIKKTYDIKIVCMLNYNKGFFHHGIVEAIQESTKAPTFVDTGTSFEVFETCDILRMNDVEFGELIKETCMYEEQVHIITKGKEGAIFFPKYEEEPIEVHIDNTTPKGIPDTTGCGDVFDISFCSCMLNSDDIQLNNNKLLEQCVRYAVDSSSEYAYQDFETRLDKDDD